MVRTLLAEKSLRAKPEDFLSANKGRTRAVVDLRGGVRDMCPPGGPNSFNFMQFLGTYGKIVRWCPLGSGVPIREASIFNEIIHTSNE